MVLFLFRSFVDYGEEKRRRGRMWAVAWARG
jgi:hypothetical protein